MGILDMFDPEVVKAMKGFGPSDEDKQKAQNMGLLQAGLGMLAANRGFGSSMALSNAIGAGGIHGLNAYERQLNDAEKDQMRQLQTAQMAQGLVKQQRQQQALQGTNAPDEVKAGLVDYKTWWEKNNPGKKWESGFDDKGRPVKGWAGPNGFEQVGGAEAKPIHWQDAGGTIFGTDGYTGLPTGARIGKSSTIADSLAAQRFAWDKTQANKPQFHDGSFVFPPTESNPEGKAVNVPGFSKPLTESQGKAAGFADRMLSAEKILNDPKMAESPGIGEAALSTLPFVGDVSANAVRNSSRQQYVQAQEDWVRAKLRKESGAVIGKDEMAQEVRTYFPQVGDSPEVIAQKSQARAQAAQGIGREGGPSYKAPEATMPRSKQFDVDGKKVLGSLGEDGKYYVMKGGKKYRVEE